MGRRQGAVGRRKGGLSESLGPGIGKEMAKNGPGARGKMTSTRMTPRGFEIRESSVFSGPPPRD